jgi:hypothetical protein
VPVTPARVARPTLRFVVVGLVVATMTLATATDAPAGAADDDWDPRIAEVAHAVERLRGLEFDHPVPVHRVSDEEFEREVTGGKITARDRAEWTRAGKVLTALGFIDGPIELEALKDDAAAFYGGYYDLHREAIVVRDEKLRTPSMRALLAHELTHALQDQHFSFDTIDRRSRHSAVPRTLTEGDADRVESLYIETRLTEREREKLYSSGDGAADGNTEGADDPASLPVIFELQRAQPYRLGSRLMWLLDAAGEQRAMDTALRNPQTDDAALLDPRALLDPSRLAPVRAPELGQRERRDGASHPFVPDFLFFMLAERMPPSAALRAAERWGGGRYVLFTGAATPCVRAALVGRNGPADATAIADALRVWSAGRPETFPIQVADDTVSFTTCIPTGTSQAVPDATLVQASEHLVLRFDIAEVGLRHGASPQQATCTADDVLARPGVAGPLRTLTSLDGPYPDDLLHELDATLDSYTVAAGCR